MFDEFAWAVGLFEGEGTTGVSRNGGLSGSRFCRLSVRSVDKDVIDRLQSVLGGKVSGPYSFAKLPLWEWQLGRQADMKEFLAAAYPHLTTHRQKQAQQVLDYIEHKAGRRTTRVKRPLDCGWRSPSGSLRAGASRHRKRGEVACERCMNLDREYSRSWYANHRKEG